MYLGKGLHQPWEREMPNVPKVLCRLVKAVKPGLLMYAECEQSVLGGVPWYITGVQTLIFFPM